MKSPYRTAQWNDIYCECTCAYIISSSTSTSNLQGMYMCGWACRWMCVCVYVLACMYVHASVHTCVYSSINLWKMFVFWFHCALFYYFNSERVSSCLLEAVAGWAPQKVSVSIVTSLLDLIWEHRKECFILMFKLVWLWLNLVREMIN